MDFIIKCSRRTVPADGRCLVEVPRYRGAAPRHGDRAFIWFAELNGGDGLFGVASIEAVTEGNPVTIALSVSDRSPVQPLNKAMLKPFRDAGTESPEGGLAAKLYKHSHQKVAAIDAAEGDFLETFFDPERSPVSAEDNEIATPGKTQRTDWSGYWAGFDPLADAAGVMRSSKLTRSTNYYHYLGGSKAVAISGFVARSRGRIGVYCAIWRPDRDRLFEALAPLKSELTDALGVAFTIVRTGTDTIHLSLPELPADPENRADWERQHQWLAANMAAAKRVFEPCFEAIGAFQPIKTR